VPQQSACCSITKSSCGRRSYWHNAQQSGASRAGDTLITASIAVLQLLEGACHGLYGRSDHAQPYGSFNICIPSGVCNRAGSCSNTLSSSGSTEVVAASLVTYSLTDHAGNFRFLVSAVNRSGRGAKLNGPPEVAGPKHWICCSSLPVTPELRASRAQVPAGCLRCRRLW